MNDKCPLQPETVNGYLDQDGCPDSAVVDSDNDGIRDSLDQCPSSPETWNRYMDHDGCPDNPSESDSDFDGILDSVDQCPLDEKDTMDSKMKTVVQTILTLLLI